MKNQILRPIAALAALTASILPLEAHNLDTTATSISFAGDFITTMSQRAAANQPLVRANDEFWVLLKTTPGPGTDTGVGGYQTFYAPDGIQVIDAAYVFPDPTDPRGFRNIPMKGQSPIAVGNGSISQSTSSEFIGWDLPGTNGLGYKTSPVTASGADRGTLAGVYADTGIFYSTDPRTAFNSYGAEAPPLTGGSSPMRNNSGDTVGEYFASNITNSTTRKVLGVMTLWDAQQLRAYGRADVSPILDENGRGNAPWGLGNVVPGPQSGYAWEFDAAAYDSTVGTHTQKLRAAIKVGPWNRIKYPGSQISQDQPGLISNVLGQAGIDASLTGIDPSAIPADSKAVRFAIGQLELGRPEYSAVKVRVNVAPGAGDCKIMNADAFGGDAGGTEGGKDHIWRYFDPTVVSLNPCTFLQKVASKSLVAPSETFHYDITFANTGSVTLPNFTITDVLPTGLTHVSATPAQATRNGQTLTWNFGTVEPGDFVTIRHYVKATGTGTLFNTATARSGINVVGVAQASVEVGVRAILNKFKTVAPSAVAPGQTVAYTLNIENIGTGNNGVPLRVREYLPPGFTFTSLQSATLNGATISSPTITVDSSNPALPLFTIGQGIQPGKKLIITFNALVGLGVQPGVYWNSFQLEYEGKIVPPIPEAPVTVGGGKIGDTVWRDWNGNGTQDAGEAGIPGVTVELYESDGTTLLRTVSTDASGRYYFPGLIADTYVVKVVPPANTTQTGDPDGTLNNQHTVILATDQQYLTADFGYRPSGSGSIGDLVFEDVGNDGVFTSGTDAGISGVIVLLYADINSDGVITPGVDALIGSTTTNGGGVYSFTGLAAGFDYVATVDPGDAALATYFGVDPFQGSTQIPQAVSNLIGNHVDADFGFWRVAPGSIGDQVFIDADGNGLYNPATDSPLSGVTVTLLRDGSPVATASSAPDGTYLFDNLGPGTYSVVVNASSMGVPSGYAPSVGQYLVNLAVGQNFLTADFPFSPLITKSVDKAFAVAGNTLNFAVNVNYTGSSLLSNVTVRDFVPNGTTYQSSGQGGSLVSFSSLPGTPGTDAGSAGGASVTLNSASGIDDTWLEENSLDRNYGGSVDLRIDPETSRPEHALVRFTLPNNLPADAVITSATLKLTKISGDPIDIIAHQADNDWAEGTLNGTNGVASWRDRLTATPWDTAGGDFIENPADPTVSSGTPTGDRNWQVAHIVQNWLDGDANHGFLLKHPIEDTGNTQNIFASSENLTVASRPTLTITYTSVARPGTSNTITATPSVVAVGSPITVTMTLQSTQAVANVVPSALQVIGGSATVSAPSPASRNLAANTPATITWTVTPSAVAEYRFSASASNGTVNFIQAVSNSALASPNGESQYVTWNLGSNEPGTLGVTATSKSLYAFGGDDTLAFWAYNTATSTWNSPADPSDTPAGVTVNSGGALTNDGTRYLYALRGDTTRVFLRYDTQTGTWSDAAVADLPLTTDKLVLKGGSLAYLNGHVYAILGNDSVQFWRYSVAGNAWTQMAGTPNAGTVNNGAGLTTDGTNIYATQGDGKKGFWRYNVAANTWSVLAPFADNIGDGGGLVHANGAIYVLRGSGQTTFRRYNIAANNWTTLAPALGNIDDGAAIGFDGVSIYALRGKTNVFYRYDIAANTWSTLSITPDTVGWGGALTFLATGNVSYTTAAAEPTLAMGVSPVTVRMSVAADSAINNITTSTPTFTATGGVTASFSAATLVSADDDISGNGDLVVYEWIATVTPGANPGKITFTTTNSAGGSALSNSVIVSPALAYAAVVGATPPAVIENTAFVWDDSGTIPETPSNTTQTATTASIGDFVWADLNADGLQDAGEYGLGGITVNLYASDGVTLLSAEVTDANGAYRFFGLAPGSYVVSYDDSTVPAGYFGTTPLTVPVTLAIGQQFNTADFGLTQPAPGTGSIGDYVWIDANNDGVQDAGEAALPGVGVILERRINGNWFTVSSTVTDTNGAYSFTSLSAASYRVTVDTGSQITSPYAQGTFSLGSVMAPTHDRDGIVTPHVALVTLATNGTVVTNADFGYNWSGSIGDFVWWDYNTDGLQNEAPLVGVPNARVQLYFDKDFNGVFDRILGDYEILRVFSDANGFYHIPNLPPGNYYVDVYEDSITTTGVRNIVPTTDDIIPVNLTSASMNPTTADFGYYEGARVEATVFWDENHNGIRDAEPLLPNITVTLTGTDNFGNPVTETALADANGNVSFLVPGGDYTISYSSADITANYPALGTPTTPQSFEFTAVPGDDGIRRFDFGVDNTGAIGDTIFADIDGNGSQSGSEPGLAGVTVNLYLDLDGNGVIDFGAGDLLLETVLTDANGKYSFGGLEDTAGASEYLVEVLASTLPDAYETEPTASPAGADVANSRYSTALIGGQVISIVDFGYPLVPDVYYTVSGTIYHDNGIGGGTSADGLPNGTEPGLGNVSVSVEVDADGDGNYDQTFNIPTDGNGFYSLGGIPEGADVRVTVIEATLPSNAYEQTGDPDGAPLSNVWLVADVLANVADIDFGYLENLGSITGTIVKGNGNGAADPGEPTLQGVTVTATYSGPDGIPGNADDDVFTTTTDANGNYSFTGLLPGDYVITTDIPTGYHEYADADGFNPNSINITLPVGADVTDRDFEYQAASLSGHVWTDANADAIRGGSEAILANITVFLDLDGNGALDPGEPSTTTDASGYYEFTGLDSGSHNVRVDPTGLPAGSFQSYDIDGLGTPNLGVVTLVPNADTTDVDFGYYLHGSIAGSVLINSSNDPIPGVALSLLDAAGDPVLDGSGNAITTLTAGDGSYTFTGLRPGNYQVLETQPNGYYSISDKDGGDKDLIGDQALIEVVSGQPNTANDFIEEISTCTPTWAAWKQIHPGQEADGNPEGDAYDNLNEFAFAMGAYSGAGDTFHIQPSVITPGKIDAVFIRPTMATLNVTYYLEYASVVGNPTVWSSIEITPAMYDSAPHSYCKELITIKDLESYIPNYDGKGVVRIRTELDEQNDTVIDHISFTEVEGWKETAFGICCQTYGVPYLRDTEFTGTVDNNGVSGNTVSFANSAGTVDLATLLAPGVSHFMEITSGPQEGQRFDIASASGATVTLTADNSVNSHLPPFNTLTGSVPTDIANSTVVIRRHWTLGEIFPAAGFGSSTDPSLADQIQIFSGGVWTLIHLFDDNGTPRWVDNFNNQVDQSGLVIQPGQGVFLNNRNGAKTLLSYGEIRANDFVRPLAPGSSLVSGGYPLNQSATGARSRDMSLAEGFVGTKDFKTADSFFVWKGDTTPGLSTYDTYYLLNGAPQNPALLRWVRVGDATATSRSAELLLLENRAVFTRSAPGLPTYGYPSPWTP